MRKLGPPLHRPPAPARTLRSNPQAEPGIPLNCPREPGVRRDHCGTCIRSRPRCRRGAHSRSLGARGDAERRHDPRGLDLRATRGIYAPRGANGTCARVLPLERLVDPRAPLKGAVRALLEGPTKTERAHGYGGWFSPRTARHLKSVRIARGVAYVDFHSFARDIPNASTSCGSA